jgi:hypothetical protein
MPLPGVRYLPTENLSVSAILANVYMSPATVKAIFYYASGNLKSTQDFSNTVGYDNLDPAYCPGATPDARRANLLADRKLSYFKGYKYYI